MKRKARDRHSRDTAILQKCPKRDRHRIFAEAAVDALELRKKLPWWAVRLPLEQSASVDELLRLELAGTSTSPVAATGEEAGVNGSKTPISGGSGA